MKRKRIRRIARRSQAAFKFPIKGGRLYLSGHNPLIRAGYPGAIGLKTGYTDEAGLCFVGVARRGRRTLGVVLLHSVNPRTPGGEAARRRLRGALGDQGDAGRGEPDRPDDVGDRRERLGEPPAGRLVTPHELERAQHQRGARRDAGHAQP